MNISENEKCGKKLAIKLLLKALMVIFIVFTQTHCSSNVNSMKKHVDDNLLKNEQIKSIVRQADIFFKNKQYTTPKGANAYDLYQEALKLEPSNTYALSKIHDIFNALLDSLYKETRNKLEPAMKDEVNRGELNNEKVVPILKNMLNILKDLNKICNTYPNTNPETEEACSVLEDKIKKYSEILSLRR